MKTWDKYPKCMEAVPALHNCLTFSFSDLNSNYKVHILFWICSQNLMTIL